MKNYFIQNLEYFKNKNSETYASIGLQVGVSANTISYWVQGNGEPKMSHLVKLAQYFEISIEILLYMDLSKVQVSQNLADQKNSKKVKDKVQVSVQDSPQNEGISDVSGAYLDKITHLQDMIDTQRVTIKVLEASNARLEQTVAKLEEENYYLKKGIPTIGGKMEDQQANVG